MLRHLLCNAACRKAPLVGSPTATTAATETMVAQLAAALAEKLAAL